MSKLAVPGTVLTHPTRWINEQLYSTPSTDAVAMMQKDPKIFSDVGNPHRDEYA